MVEGVSYYVFLSFSQNEPAFTKKKLKKHSHTYGRIVDHEIS